MTDTATPLPGTGWHHTKTGRRIKYDPEWSESLPYTTFIGGTAMTSFTSLKRAAEYINVHPDDLTEVAP